MAFSPDAATACSTDTSSARATSSVPPRAAKSRARLRTVLSSYGWLRPVQTGSPSAWRSAAAQPTEGISRPTRTARCIAMSGAPPLGGSGCAAIWRAKSSSGSARSAGTTSEPTAEQGRGVAAAERTKGGPVTFAGPSCRGLPGARCASFADAKVSRISESLGIDSAGSWALIHREMSRVPMWIGRRVRRSA